MKTWLALLGLAVAGCATARATAYPLSKERATECTKHCETLEMRLAAVVVIMNSAGCVCEPKDARAGVASGGAAAAGGAAIATALEAQRQQQQRQQQQGAYRPPSR